MDALENELQRQDPSQLSLARPNRRVNAHHHVRADPCGSAYEGIRGRGCPLEPVLVPDGQALPLAQGGHGGDSNSQLVDQDRPVDIRKCLLEPTPLSLGRRGARPACPENAGRPGQGLDARPEVLLHLRAQKAGLGKGLALDPIVLAAEVPPDQVGDQDQKGERGRDGRGDEGAPEGALGSALPRLPF